MWKQARQLPPRLRRRELAWLNFASRMCIRRPLITEKNTRLMEIGQYTFEVDPQANKSRSVTRSKRHSTCSVKAVNTLNVKPKPKSRYASRRGGRIVGAKPGWKKAIVTPVSGRAHRPLRAGLDEHGKKEPDRCQFANTSPLRRAVAQMSVSTFEEITKNDAGENRS